MKVELSLTTKNLAPLKMSFRMLQTDFCRQR
jgi:hypothetical protein